MFFQFGYVSQCRIDRHSTRLYAQSCMRFALRLYPFPGNGSDLREQWGRAARRVARVAQADPLHRRTRLLVARADREERTLRRHESREDRRTRLPHRRRWRVCELCSHTGQAIILILPIIISKQMHENYFWDLFCFWNHLIMFSFVSADL